MTIPPELQYIMAAGFGRTAMGNPLLGAGSPLLSASNAASSTADYDSAKDRDVRRLGSFFRIEEQSVIREYLEYTVKHAFV